MMTPKPGLCIDCWQEDPTGTQGDRRPAIWPGPRCQTHHRAIVKKRKDASKQRDTSVLYGVDYLALVASQGGRCAGCGKLPGPRSRRLAVDHDHAQAKLDGHDPDKGCRKCVRGALCFDCNTTLATYRDNAEALAGLVAYLLRWRNRELRR